MQKISKGGIGLFSVIEKLNPIAVVLILGIVGIFVAALITTIIIRKKYININKDLSDYENRKREEYDHEILNLIIEDYKNAAQGNYNEVNTQAIIERNFNNALKGVNIGERFVKNAVSLMIILGLLGTFYGLTLSIGKLVELLSASGNVDMLSSMDSIVSGLINSVKGMSVAFVTSLFGIACSVILTIFHIIYDVESEREDLMVQIEAYLDNNVALEISKNQENEHEIFNKALADTFKNLGNQIENSFQYVIDEFSKNLSGATSEIGLSSKALLESIHLFDKSLEKFIENTRDFSEFNYHLRTNIERMNVSFADLTEDLKEYAKEIAVTKTNE